MVESSQEENFNSQERAEVALLEIERSVLDFKSEPNHDLFFHNLGEKLDQLEEYYASESESLWKELIGQVRLLIAKAKNQDLPAEIQLRDPILKALDLIWFEIHGLIDEEDRQTEPLSLIQEIGELLTQSLVSEECAIADQLASLTLQHLSDS